MRGSISRFIADERGATAVEYGVIVALMCVAVIGAFSAFGSAGENLIAGALLRLRDAIAG